MASTSFRSTVPAFDADAFAKFTQGPDRAGSVNMAANALSPGSSRPVYYDVDSLREVMGGGRPSQYTTKPASDTFERKQEQLSQLKLQQLQAASLRSELQRKKNLNEKQPTRGGQKHTKTDQQGSPIFDPYNNSSRFAAFEPDPFIGRPSNSRQKVKDSQRKNHKGPPGIRPSQLAPGLSSSHKPRANKKQIQAEQSSHALQDYQMQLMLLEQQNKKRLLMARQEQDNMLQQMTNNPESRRYPVIPGEEIRRYPVIPGEEGRVRETSNSEEPASASRASEIPRPKTVVTPHTISEDDTVPEFERQSRRLIALQRPPEALPAAPRDWRP